MVARGGIEPPTFRFSGGRSYRLSYLAGRQHVPHRPGDPDGTRTRDLRRDRARANQLRHRALLCCVLRDTASQVPPTGFEPALPP